VNVVLRKRLDLFANVRPVRMLQVSRRATGHAHRLIIFRENTEDLYAGIEHE